MTANEVAVRECLGTIDSGKSGKLVTAEKASVRMLGPVSADDFGE